MTGDTPPLSGAVARSRADAGAKPDRGGQECRGDGERPVGTQRADVIAALAKDRQRQLRPLLARFAFGLARGRSGRWFAGRASESAARYRSRAVDAAAVVGCRLSILASAAMTSARCVTVVSISRGIPCPPLSGSRQRSPGSAPPAP